MNITVEIKAPELVKAIETLAAALAGNQIVSSPVVSMEEKKAAKAAVKEEKPEKEAQQKEEEAPKEDPLPEEMKDDAPEVSLETVRAQLAKLSQAGKSAEVKKLITKFGAKKLTEVPSDKYAELLAEAEEIA